MKRYALPKWILAAAVMAALVALWLPAAPPLDIPLWLAPTLFFPCLILALVSFRLYRRGGGKLFLALALAVSLLGIAALLYAACGLLLVSAVR